MATGSVDSVLASLVLSYLPDARASLREIRRVLRPGGKLVLSSLKIDADISRIYTSGVEELTSQLGTEASDADRQELEVSMRSFLNEAARLLELEESGEFTFWSGTQLAQLVSDAGFRDPVVSEAFGDPPQAIVISASR